MSSCLTLLLISLICLGITDVLSDIELEHVLFRNVRNTPSDQEECCGKGKPEYTDEEMKTLRECWEEAQGKIKDDSPEVNRRITECTTYCLARRGNFVDENGYLIKEKFEKSIMDYYPEDAVKQVVARNVHNCTKRFNKFAKDHWEKDKDKFCNPAAYHGSYCLMESVELDCPEEFKSKTETCKRRNNKLQAKWRRTK